MSQYRAPTAYVLVVLLLLAVIVLTTPDGGTHAHRSTTARTEVPATGRIGFEVAAEGGEDPAPGTSTSGAGAGHRPLQVPLAGSTGEPVTPPAGM